MLIDAFSHQIIQQFREEKKSFGLPQRLETSKHYDRERPICVHKSRNQTTAAQFTDPSALWRANCKLYAFILAIYALIEVLPHSQQDVEREG